MKKIIIVSLLCFSVVFAQTPATINTSKQVPIQQSSYQPSQVIALVQELQQRIVDLQSLIALQGKEIQVLKTQQQQLYSDLNNKISTLKATSESTTESKFGNVTPLVKKSKKDDKPAVPQQETRQFQLAYKLMQSRQYSDAIQGFNRYLKKYPNGYYAADSYYWFGELYVVAGDNNKASLQLQTVAEQFPNSAQAPDAMLKLASIANDQQDFDQAVGWWQKIVNQYPQSSAARVANKKMEQITQAD